MTEIMLLAYDLLDEFLNLEDYQKLKETSKLVDHKYIEDIHAFEEAKRTYEEIMNEGGVYHPDFKSASKKLSLLKTNLYEKPEVANLLALEKKVQTLLNHLIEDIKNVVSPHLKTPNEIGVVHKGGTHGCK